MRSPFEHAEIASSHLPRFDAIQCFRIEACLDYHSTHACSPFGKFMLRGTFSRMENLPITRIVSAVSLWGDQQICQGSGIRRRATVSGTFPPRNIEMFALHHKTGLRERSGDFEACGGTRFHFHVNRREHHVVVPNIVRATLDHPRSAAEIRHVLRPRDDPLLRPLIGNIADMLLCNRGRFKTYARCPLMENDMLST